MESCGNQLPWFFCGGFGGGSGGGGGTGWSCGGLGGAAVVVRGVRNLSML